MTEAAARATRRRRTGTPGLRDAGTVEPRSRQHAFAHPPYAARPRLDEVLADDDWRVAVLVAPPGYGKSAVARRWVERRDARVASLSLDGLTNDEVLPRLRAALASLFPGVDTPHRFDGEAVVDALADVDDEWPAATLLVDGQRSLEDSSFWDVLSELVDALGPRLRVLVTCQVDPPLPILRWRSEGIVRVLREGDLRLVDHEAIAAGSVLGRELPADTVSELNRRVEGWPLALTLGLMAVGDDWSGDEPHPELLVDSLVASVVDRLDPCHRDIALALSVFEWFDDSLAVAVVGPEARPVLAELRRRHLVEPAEPGLGLRFHGLVRALLAADMRWHDPDRFSQLHQRAFDYWLQRGDLASAYRHVGSLRDRVDVHRLVVEPALALVDAGDRAGLGRLLAALPRSGAIDDAAIALDVATVAFFAGDRRGAARWIERAETVGLHEDALAVRAHSTRSTLALMDGRIDAATRESQRFLDIRARAVPGGPIEERFGLVAARLALLRLDVVGAQRWIDHVRTLSVPPVVSEVTIAGLQSWHDGLVGLGRQAVEAATGALDRVAGHACGVHQSAFDATVAAAWACLRVGDIGSAERFASRALADGARLGYDWNVVRSAEIAAKVHLAARRPSEALAVVTSARGRLAIADSELAGGLAVAEASAQWLVGRDPAAIELLDGIADRPDARLARAAIALECDDCRLLGEVLDGAGSWLMPHRVEAELLTAVASGNDGRLLGVVEEAAAVGLMLPFLGQGRRVETALLGLSLEAIHPTLIDYLRGTDRAVVHVGRVASFTLRERSILDLLPSHLTYAEIAAHLDVSVNTVKGNLKSIYRKLEVSARADAVEAARSQHIE